MSVLEKLRKMVATVRESPDLERDLKDMGFSAERAEALAENKSIRGARTLDKEHQ